jgi:paraquat-inducible protein B
VAAWLVYTALSESGPTITIAFDTATGLEAKKTKIKYKDVDFGLVESVEVTDDLQQVIVTANLEKQAEPHLNENTRFWVVRPRLGVGGVSGLETLVSGAFVEIDPGDGPPRRDFIGLEEPPVVRSDEPGKQFVLTSESMGSIGRGSPIYFRGLAVGEVFDRKLAEDKRSVEISIFVKVPFDQLVHDNSLFWNASGFDVTFGVDGFQIKTESLETILAGGVSFETPAASDSQPAAEGTVFALHDNAEKARQPTLVRKIPYLTRFTDSVRGLQMGAPVEFRGIRIGTVTDIRAQFDPERGVFDIPVTFEIEVERLGAEQVRASTNPYETAARLVEQGLRTQLVSGNLLTGQLFIALDFFPDAEPATLDRSGRYPLVPSVLSTIGQFKQSIEGILVELSNLKLPALIADARKTLQSIDGLASSPEIVRAIGSLESTLKRTESLVSQVDQKIGPLMDSVTTTSETAQGTLVQASATLKTADNVVGANSQVVYGLNELLEELTQAARSIRVLADYLEENPEALLRGKSGNQ